MESRIVFATGRKSRYDSWDMENLKYIRKKSQSNLLDKSDYLETESYTSGNQFKESDELLLEASAMFNQTYSTTPTSTNDGLGLISLKPSKSSNPLFVDHNQHDRDAGGGRVGVFRGNDDRTELDGGGNSCDSKCNRNRSISGFPYEPFGNRELPEDNSLEYPHPVGRDETNAKFDECYILDVVTIRNASVFADRNPHNKKTTSAVKTKTETTRGFKKSKIPVFVRSNINLNVRSYGTTDVNEVCGNKLITKIGSGSAESASSSSSISSIDDGVVCTEYDQERRYNTSYSSPVDEDLPKTNSHFYIDSSRECSRSVNSIASDLDTEGREMKQRVLPPPNCPFCSDSSSTSSYYYLGQKMNNDRESPRGQRDDRMALQLQETRTPSPYYVRLRRDVCNYTPPLCAPRNFGMDKQGQLVIDYSSNWAGLENYIKNLNAT